MGPLHYRPTCSAVRADQPRRTARPPAPRHPSLLTMAAAAPTRSTDPRADDLRAKYLATFGGGEIPVPVESIAEDFLGLRIE